MDFIYIDYLYLINMKFNRCVFDDFLNKNYFIVVWKYLVCIYKFFLVFWVDKKKYYVKGKVSKYFFIFFFVLLWICLLLFFLWKNYVC